MKIDKKYRNIIFSCLAAVFISVPMAFVMVVINLGFVKGFIIAFIKSALAGTAISIPLANVAIPVAEKITHRMIESD